MNKNAIQSVKQLIYEIENPRNDGWVLKHYIDELLSIKKIVDEKIKEIEER